jgi:D-alanyl-lipoteichoic acid acyltransferase DltB (MBOAT superfamily)
LHGAALVIHRAWQKINFKLNRILAWFITFNFINISWIFFRAKDWDSAIKVLSSMLGFNDIVLPEKIAIKLNFLSNYGISFGEVTMHIGDGSKNLNWILAAFVLILVFKNSNQRAKNFKENKSMILFTVFLLFFGILSVTRVSEFLYFNF